MSMHDPSQDDDELTAAINVTPFVDVVLVLLVIFMITSDFIRPSAIELELPRAANGGQTVPQTLNLVVDKTGQLLVDGEKTEENGLHQKLNTATAGGKKPQVVIAADRGVDYGHVIHLIDLVKSHGIDDFALQVERG
jgi:biopolymer transport protein ExbD